MRVNLNLLVAFLPLIAGSPLNLYENPKTNDASGVSVSLEDTITAPIAAAVEGHEVLQSRATKAKTTKGQGTCPAKSTKGTKGAKSKATRWLSGLTRRNGEYGTLSIPTTANPIDKWATDIYKAGDRNREVYIDFESSKPHMKPTSGFEDHGDSPFYMTLTGLYGCTGLVVTSNCGSYMAHFWQYSMDDDAYNGRGGYTKDAKNTFIAAVSDPIRGILNKAADHDANKGMQFKQAMAPNPDFISLTSHADCLNTDMGVKAFIFTPQKGNNPAELLNPDTVDALKAVVSDITKLPVAQIPTHTYKVIGETQARGKTNGDGKIMLTYSPDTGATPYERAYQVHVKKTDKPDVTMAVGDTWTGDAKKCTCKGEPLKVKQHEVKCCPCM